MKGLEELLQPIILQHKIIINAEASFIVQGYSQSARHVKKGNCTFAFSKDI